MSAQILEGGQPRRAARPARKGNCWRRAGPNSARANCAGHPAILVRGASRRAPQTLKLAARRLARLSPEGWWLLEKKIWRGKKSAAKRIRPFACEFRCHRDIRTAPKVARSGTLGVSGRQGLRRACARPAQGLRRACAGPARGLAGPAQDLAGPARGLTGPAQGVRGASQGLHTAWHGLHVASQGLRRAVRTCARPSQGLARLEARYSNQGGGTPEGLEAKYSNRWGQPRLWALNIQIIFKI